MREPEPAPHPRVLSDETLPRRLRARRWAYDGAREAFPPTAHGGFEVGWLACGALGYRVGTRVLEVTPGAAVLIPLGVEHATEFVGPLLGASVHLDDGLVVGVAEAAGVVLPTAPVLLPDGAALVTLGRMVHDELAHDGVEARLCADALAEALAARVVAAVAPVRGPMDARVRRAVEYVHAAFAEPIDVDDLASASGTSRFHLSRLFKAALGRSPYQYLLDVRLDEAARLLRRGRTVTDAALSAGFSDLSRFARMFQRRFGARPSAYAVHHAPHRASTATRSSSSMAPSALVS